MRKKTKAKRTAKTSRPRKTARKAAPVRKARAQRQAPTATDGSGPRTFRLVAGIPEQPREGTHGRAILDSIHERRLATFADIRSDVPKAVADATLRKYLVMFKAEKIIAVEGE